MRPAYERLLIKTELSVWFSVDCGSDWDAKEATTTTTPKRCLLLIAGAVLDVKCNNSAECETEATCDHTNTCSEYSDGVCGTLSSQSKQQVPVHVIQIWFYDSLTLLNANGKLLIANNHSVSRFKCQSDKVIFVSATNKLSFRV